MPPLYILFSLLLAIFILSMLSVMFMSAYFHNNKCCDNYKNWKKCFPKSNLRGFYKTCKKDDGMCCPTEGNTKADCRDNYGDTVETRYECNILDKCKWYDEKTSCTCDTGTWSSSGNVPCAACPDGSCEDGNDACKQSCGS